MSLPSPDPSSACACAPWAGETVHWLRVALDVPLPGLFDYRAHQPVPAGTRVIVPFGRRKLIGLVLEVADEPAIQPHLVKPIEQVLDDLPPMPEDWLRLARFAAQYYQRPVGEVVLPTLPASLRKVSAYQGKRSAGGPVKRSDASAGATPAPIEPAAVPVLNAAQEGAAEAVCELQGCKTVLLHGFTGSA